LRPGELVRFTFTARDQDGWPYAADVGAVRPGTRAPTIPSVRARAFVKGHGTENDFVLLPDGAGTLELDAKTVAALCDRRAGVGGDGVLRAVLCANEPEAAAMAGEAAWFMDYRNADGSIAEMCGNGARVFARYLVDAGLVPPGELIFGTRAGLVRAYAERTGPVRVTIGPYDLPATEAFTVAVEDRPHAWPGVRVLMPNPHAVVTVATITDAGSLRAPPSVDPETTFVEGVNVEFVMPVADRHIAMRVFERGVGETRSCGTGVAAAAVARALADGALPGPEGASVTYVVDVPGGRLEAAVRPDRMVDLIGPAVLVAEGTVDLDAF
jgi:diaminopimelate epimerase